jgi:hypothetical protein
VAGWVTDSIRSENFVAFLADLAAQTPRGLDLHYIVDNLKIHGTDWVHAFVAEHPLVHLHFTRPMPIGSTRSSCSFPSCSVARYDDQSTASRRVAPVRPARAGHHGRAVQGPIATQQNLDAVFDYQAYSVSLAA